MPVEGERTVLDTDATGDVQNTEGGYLYADDFEYTGKTVPVLDGKGGFTGEKEDYIASRGGEKGAMARYTHTLNGAFEVYKEVAPAIMCFASSWIRSQQVSESVGITEILSR